MKPSIINKPIKDPFPNNAEKMQKTNIRNPNHHFFKPDNPWFLCITLFILIGGVSLIFSITRYPLQNCGGAWGSLSAGNTTTLEMNALLHYATSRVVPQQSYSEIRLSFDVLRSISPCNFLVFGLGHDSLMWAALNPRGRTLFLEEDPKWVQTVLKDAPALRAQTVPYRTQLSQADELLRHYEAEPDCSPEKLFLRGNEKCRLALNMLSNEVYDTEWDIIMIDAPRGYFPEAPGRMAAIYSAAIMARSRKKSDVTHVYLHDVERKVEKMYAEKFLCKKYLVKGVGRLWHFEIPPATNGSREFC